ncbi:hypothetical protein ACLB2K_018905 [Fragaria x ananassa]
MEDAYARSATEVLDFFGVDPKRGLSDSQVSEHARLYGRNAWLVGLEQEEEDHQKILRPSDSSEYRSSYTAVTQLRRILALGVLLPGRPFG